MTFRFVLHLWSFGFSSSVKGGNGWILVLLVLESLSLISCTELKPPPEYKKPEKITPTTVSLMPNLAGYFEVTVDDDTQRIPLKGSWYWYDGKYATMKNVYAVGKHKKHDQLYFWLNEPSHEIIVENDEPLFENVTTHPAVSVCAEGRVGKGYGIKQFASDPDEYQVSLGFELCSPNDWEGPTELPRTLGQCGVDDVENDTTPLSERFSKVSFDIDLTVFDGDKWGSIKDRVKKIEVQFKQWGTLDEEQPFCVVYVNTPEPERDTSAALCAYDVTDNGYKIIAAAKEAKGRSTDKGSENSSEPKWALPNLERLQAIHIQVYEVPDDDYDRLGFCVRDVEASLFDIEASTESSASSTDEPHVSVCGDAGVEDTLLMDASFVPQDGIDAEGAGHKFKIMKNEVTVAQFVAWKDHVEEPDGKWRLWESCTEYLYKAVDETEYARRPINCVTQCQAERFCSSIGASLPSEREWVSAAAQFGPALADTCEAGAVMNNVGDEHDRGVGCGETRLPLEACQNVQEKNPEVPCDMYGNLWEWVTDVETSETSIFKGYGVIKGGSLNSLDSKLERSELRTLEHPTEPHSPIRLGFRCIKNLD